MTYIRVLTDSVQVTQTRSGNRYRGIFTVTVDNLFFIALVDANTGQGGGLSILGTKDCFVLKEFLQVNVLAKWRRRGDIRGACRKRRLMMRPWQGRASRSSLSVSLDFHGCITALTVSFEFAENDTGAE
jgi:hypothetical protein